MDPVCQIGEKGANLKDDTAAYVLTAYALSDAFRRKITSITGQDARYISVAELRKKGLRGMFRYLRMMDRNGILYIPMEDPTSESIFPLILGLVVASSVRQIVVLDADCSVKSIRRLQVAPAIARVALGTTLGFAAWIRSQVASRALLTRRIQEVDIDEQRHSFVL